MRGIDISNANGTLDWAAIKAAGVEFAILRSSYGSDIPGQTDRQFVNNAEGCIKNGIPFMTYHFAYFTDERSAEEEAAHALRLAGQYPQIKAIALDLEEDTERYARETGMSPDWTACCEAFLESIRAAGYIPVFYTNQNWMNNKLEYKRLKKYPLWLAAPYADESIPKRYGNIVLWQDSWNGSISGIAGLVDTDVCYDKGLLFRGTGQKSPIAKPPADEIGQLLSSAKDDSYAVVTAEDGVNIRRGASTVYEIIGAVPCGTKLHITRRTSGGGHDWGLTSYGGITGWVALTYTRRAEKKTVDELALEVIRGEWGSGDERVRLLTESGYDYAAVQKRVNELM